MRRHKYTNPGHHDPRGGPNPYNPRKSVLPENHVQLFRDSVPFETPGGVLRYARDADGNIHRFEPHLSDTYHWSGQTNGRTLRGEERGLHVPAEVRKTLGG